jgi:hypothetical protein
MYVWKVFKYNLVYICPYINFSEERIAFCKERARHSHHNKTVNLLDHLGTELNFPDKFERRALIIICVRSSHYVAVGYSPREEHTVKDLHWC